MPRIIKPAPGTFTAATVTVDSSGRVISASSGSAGEKSMLPAFGDYGPNTGTYTANSSATQIFVYLRAGGGGGGGMGIGQNTPGQHGGYGGFGIFSIPVSAPYSVPYSLGAGGNPGTGNNTNVAGNPGGAGASSTWNTNDAVTNGGTAGNYNGGPTAANSGTAPGAKIDLSLSPGSPNAAAEVYENVTPLMNFGTGFVPNTDTNFMVKVGIHGRGGFGGPAGGTRAGGAGRPGAVFVYENLGV